MFRNCSSSIFILITIGICASKPPEKVKNYCYLNDILENLTIDVGNLNQSVKRLSKEFEALKNSTTNNFEENKPRKMPANCAEALPEGSNRESGTYQLQLAKPNSEPFYAYCMHSSDGGAAWTVVQRRQNGNIDFYRYWNEYKNGFGHLNGDFFWGLEKLHLMTYSKLHELWIDMRDLNDVRQSVKYDSFIIGDEQSEYTLSNLGKFHGDVGDSLTLHAGQKFQTRRNENDESAEMNLAETYEGAWWYYSKGLLSNLNGRWRHGEYSEQDMGTGINWETWHGRNYSLTYVHMAIRPVHRLY